MSVDSNVLERAVRDALYELVSNPLSALFLVPVVEQFPEIQEVYFAAIRRPLDLTTICKRAVRGRYAGVDGAARCARRVRRVFANCERFNGDVPQYRELARHLRQHFDELWDFFVGRAIEAPPASRAAADERRKARSAWRDRLFDAGRCDPLSRAERARAGRAAAACGRAADEDGGVPTLGDLFSRIRGEASEACGDAADAASPARRRSAAGASHNDASVARPELPAALASLEVVLALRCGERRLRGCAASSCWAAVVAVKWAKHGNSLWPVGVLGLGGGCAVAAANLKRVGAKPRDALEGGIRKVNPKARDASFSLLEFFGTHELAWARTEALVDDEAGSAKNAAPQKRSARERDLLDAALIEAEMVRVDLDEMRDPDDFEAEARAARIFAAAGDARPDDQSSSGAPSDDDSSTDGERAAAAAPAVRRPPPVADDDDDADDGSAPPPKRRGSNGRARAGSAAAGDNAKPRKAPSKPRNGARSSLVERDDDDEDEEVPPPPPRKKPSGARKAEAKVSAPKKEPFPRGKPRTAAADRRISARAKVDAYLAMLRAKFDAAAADAPAPSPAGQPKRKRAASTGAPDAGPREAAHARGGGDDDDGDDDETGLTDSEPRFRASTERDSAQAAAKAAIDEGTDSETECLHESTQSRDGEARCHALRTIKQRLEAEVAALSVLQVRCSRTAAARAVCDAKVDEARRFATASRIVAVVRGRPGLSTSLPRRN
ncbi:hypothetical protein M885DRAFT_505378 [Pelagophyceae sp. CCMP2097]|nr:hypothetical protein M885DRAFT_505378 [Pelagophyceae sp. CCMP2097]